MIKKTTNESPLLELENKLTNINSPIKKILLLKLFSEYSEILVETNTEKLSKFFDKENIDKVINHGVENHLKIYSKLTKAKIELIRKKKFDDELAKVIKEKDCDHVLETNKVTSFEWTSNNKLQVRHLYDKLRRANCIQTSIYNFKKLFISSTDYTQIEWKKSGKELVYLFELLIKHNFIKDPKRDKWKIFDSCFKSHLKYNCLAATSCVISKNSNTVKRKEFYSSIVEELVEL
ncbi:MAG: hypothetical protein R2852_06640 [Bacteroidia bacterium]